MSGTSPIKVLLTGQPGTGKTTLLIKLARSLERLNPRGFYTEEVRDVTSGQRTGFRIRTLSGRQGVLSRAGKGVGPRVGKYVVDVAEVDRLCVPEMDCPEEGGLVLIDEIGKMECLSPAFRDAAVRLMGSGCPVVATIAKRGGPFIDSLKTGAGMRVVEVTRENRDLLCDRLLREIGEAVG